MVDESSIRDAGFARWGGRVRGEAAADPWDGVGPSGWDCGGLAEGLEVGAVGGCRGVGFDGTVSVVGGSPCAADGVKFDEDVHEPVDGAQQGKLLEELDAAVVGEDEAKEVGDELPAVGISGGGLDDQRFAEEVVNGGVDAPADVVFDDDFLACDACGEGRGIEVAPGSHAGQTGWESPFLRLSIGTGGALVGSVGGKQPHGIAVVGPESAVVGLALEEVFEQGVEIEGEWFHVGSFVRGFVFALCKYGRECAHWALGRDGGGDLWRKKLEIFLFFGLGDVRAGVRGAQRRVVGL